MPTYTGIDADYAVMGFGFAHAAKLPEDQRNFLVQTLSGADGLRKIIVCLEVLYASRADKKFPKEAVQLMHDLAEYVHRFNFYGMGGLDGRAIKIMTVAQRMLDGGVAETEGDIPVSDQYSAPKPAEMPTPTPTPIPAE